jgi:hypothetical protein
MEDNEDHGCDDPRTCPICITRGRLTVRLRQLNEGPEIEWESTVGGLAVLLPNAAMRLAAIRREWCDDDAGEGQDRAALAADALTAVMTAITGIIDVDFEFDDMADDGQ